MAESGGCGASRAPRPSDTRPFAQRAPLTAVRFRVHRRLPALRRLAARRSLAGSCSLDSLGSNSVSVSRVGRIGTTESTGLALA